MSYSLVMWHPAEFVGGGRAPSQHVKDFTLYFVRHGESVANVSAGVGDRRAGVAELSERGWEQARGLGRACRARGSS